MSYISLLPPELVDGILDRISDDLTSLKACTTVCKGWINRSRYHLFSSLRVCGTSDGFVGFANFLENTTSSAYDAAGGSPTGLPVVVRSLCLDGKGSGQKPCLTFGTLQSIIRRLPNLCALHFTVLRLDDQDFTPAKPVPLEVLTLVSVDASSPASAGDEFLALLSLFSTIDSVFLRFVHFNRYPITHGDALVHPSLAHDHERFPAKLQVRNLRLHLPRHTAFFLELIRRTATRRTLTSLRVTSRTTEKFEAIGAFCKDAEIGRTLQQLEVDLKYCIPRKYR